QTLTDADGKFAFPAIASGGILRARKGKMGLLQTVTIDNDNRDLKLVLHRDPTGSVTLLAVTGDGEPLPGALVGIQSSDSREIAPPRWATTGADGSFVLENAYPDLIYNVTVHLHGYTTASVAPKVEGGKKTIGPFIRLYKTDSAITG